MSAEVLREAAALTPSAPWLYVITVTVALVGLLLLAGRAVR